MGETDKCKELNHLDKDVTVKTRVWTKMNTHGLTGC